VLVRVCSPVCADVSAHITAELRCRRAHPVIMGGETLYPYIKNDMILHIFSINTSLRVRDQ